MPSVVLGCHMTSSSVPPANGTLLRVVKGVMAGGASTGASVSSWGARAGAACTSACPGVASADATVERMLSVRSRRVLGQVTVSDGPRREFPALQVTFRTEGSHCARFAGSSDRDCRLEQAIGKTPWGCSIAGKLGDHTVGSVGPVFEDDPVGTNRCAARCRVQKRILEIAM